MDDTMLLFFILIGLCFFGFSYAFLWFRFQSSLRIQRRLGQLKSLSNQSAEEIEAKKGFFSRNIMPFMRDISIKVASYAPDELKNNISIKLSQAKYPLGLNPNEFVGFSIIFAVVSPAVLVLLAYVSHADYKTMLWVAVGGGVLGVLLPVFIVKSKVSKLTNDIRSSLPFSIDLLTVCVEAGLGFNAALAKVTDKGEGVLNDEFRRVLKEISMGKSRPEALQGLADRNKSVEELGVLVNTITQTEKMGVPIAKVLRVQSDEIRRKRRQRIEEAAAKLPVKMMFPLVFFTFPVMFIILLGPAMISIMDMFSSQ